MHPSAPAQPDYGPPLGDQVCLRLIQFDRMTIDRTWRAQNVCSSFWRLYRNADHGAALLLDGHALALNPGCVYLVPAWVRFSCRCTGPVDHLYAHFELVGLATAILRQLFDRPIALPADPLCRGLLDAAAAGIDHDPTAAPLDRLCRVKAAIHAALARPLADLSSGDHRRLTAALRPDHPVHPAVAFIEANLHRPLTSASLARRCALSRSHFTRRFTRAMGQTPGQYIIERRVSRAARALLFTGKTIDAIALECGFADRFYFTRVFKRRMGLPPAAYRRSQVV